MSSFPEGLDGEGRPAESCKIFVGGALTETKHQANVCVLLL